MSGFDTSELRSAQNARSGSSKSGLAKMLADDRAQARLPLCEACNMPVPFEQSVMRSGGRTWHKKCLVCSSCGTGLSGAQYSEAADGSMMCSNCTNGNSRAGMICAQCDEPIGTFGFVQALGQIWHAGHFICAHEDCVVELEGSYFIKDNKGYCEDHKPAKVVRKTVTKKKVKKGKNGKEDKVVKETKEDIELDEDGNEIPKKKPPPQVICVIS